MGKTEQAEPRAGWVARWASGGSTVGGMRRASRAGYGLAVCVALVLAVAGLFAERTPSAAAAVSGVAPQAATVVLTVTTTIDNNDPCTPAACSLRAAISATNASTETQPVIHVPAGHYRLTLAGENEDANQTGDLDILRQVIVRGEGAQYTIIDGNGLDRVIQVINNEPMPIFVQFENLSIQGGKLDDSGGGVFAGSAAIVSFLYTEVRNNESTGGDGGGGIYGQGASVITLRHSAVVSNVSNFRGGGMVVNGNMQAENSTISGNRALLGGGIYGNNAGNTRNVTITANDSGGLHVAPGTNFLINNTIIAGNIGNDCQGSVDSNGFNLVSSACPLTTSTSSDISTDDAKLGPLALNGGATRNHAPLPDSPAIDAGSDQQPGSGSNACAVRDQRDADRPVDGNGDGTARCDIGAVEYVPATEEPEEPEQPGEPGDGPKVIYLPSLLR